MACKILSDKDPALSRAFAEIGIPVWRDNPSDYKTLARIIAYQQISVTAAGKIWQRVENTLGDITPGSILSATEDDMRGYGLSRPKIRHLVSVAMAVQSGTLNLEEIQSAKDKDARKTLLSIKGIGPWTAEVYCLYARGEMDAFPTSDVGLMESYRLLNRSEERPTSKEFSDISRSWKPYRGVGAHLLWAWLGAQRLKQKQD